jgi:hypothetical protein
MDYYVGHHLFDNVADTRPVENAETAHMQRKTHMSDAPTQNGKMATFTFTAPRGLRERVQKELILPIRQRSGFYGTHSSLIQAMLKIVIEVAPEIDYSIIDGQEALMRAVRTAIARRAE